MVTALLEALSITRTPVLHGRRNVVAMRKSRGMRAALVVGASVLGASWFGCSSPRSPARAPGSGQAAICGVDETREYYCEDLLPLSSSMPAPSPYQACPASIDEPSGVYDPPATIGLFDTSYTEYIRKRAPPGHACCFSWCSHVKVADPRAPSIRQACQMATAFREQYCMAEPESGTTLPAAAPFNRCPAAIVPPARAVFAVPPAAPFDFQLTASHRGKGEADCCYAWCSEAPAGSGLQRQQP